MSLLNVLIVDDHAIARYGLRRILEEKVPATYVQEAASVEEATPFIRNMLWDLVLLDLALPGRNGLDLLIDIKRQGLATPVLIVSAYEETLYAIRALQAGASGYLTKGAVLTELEGALRALFNGERYISGSVAQLLARSFQAPGLTTGYQCLSERELEVLQKIGSGMAVAEIASALHLSVKTISTYRTRLTKKLNLKNNAEITRYAFSVGLVHSLYD